MQRVSDVAAQAEPAPRQQSSGLATALAALADDGSARVLDLGSASAGSVAYFTARVRELFIADLPRALRIEVPGQVPPIPSSKVSYRCCCRPSKHVST